MRNRLWAAALAIASGLAGCGTESTPKNSLDFGTNKAALAVGDTSETWKATKTVIDANGRTVTSEYYSFHLISSDSTVAKVVQQQRLLGLKAGEAVITARDDKSSLKTEADVTVTVSAVP
ncbi:MAG: hypothetical protein JWP91_123 [Fibrobacteres bacterium]|nr:hypothetical protein [Fibrobacterota bacterium]